MTLLEREQFLSKDSEKVGKTGPAIGRTRARVLGDPVFYEDPARAEKGRDSSDYRVADS
jgi:hypothetical protein